MPTIVPYTFEKKEEKVIDFISLIKNMKVLIATEKPFAQKAVNGIKEILEAADMQVVLLEKYTDKAQLLEAVADVDAMIVRSDKVTAEVMDAARNLKIVVRAGAGFDNVDCCEAKRRGIVVMNTPGQNSNAVAELALAMMIFMSRNEFTPGTGSEIKGKTLAIHAYGNVGRLVGCKGKALGMNVIAYDPFVSDCNVFTCDGVEKVESLDELYSRADFLSLHIPATEQTKGSIGYELLTRMRNPRKHRPQGGYRRAGAETRTHRARGFEVRHRRCAGVCTGVVRMFRQTLLRNSEKDGSRDCRSKYQCRLGCGSSDCRLFHDGQHPFSGKQIKKRP